MSCIKVDAAFVLNTFGICKNKDAVLLWCHILFTIQKTKKNVIDLPPEDVKIAIPFIRTRPELVIKQLVNICLLLPLGDDKYQVFDEKVLCDNMRKQRRERVYTRNVLFEISDKFFYTFIANIDLTYIFITYYFLYLLCQFDLWPGVKQIRSPLSLKFIRNIYTKILANEFVMVFCFEELRRLGLLFVDQERQLHLRSDINTSNLDPEGTRYFFNNKWYNTNRKNRSTKSGDVKVSTDMQLVY